LDSIYRLFIVLFLYVCSVDGQYLNYDNDPLLKTDFWGLCSAMVKLHAPNKMLRITTVRDD